MDLGICVGMPLSAGVLTTLVFSVFAGFLCLSLDFAIWKGKLVLQGFQHCLIGKEIDVPDASLLL